MRSVAGAAAVVLVLVLVLGAAAGEAAERRCGWVENPTPGNWYLRDRQGNWAIAEAGLHGAAGFDDMPDMRAGGWVDTNRGYGHGCGCLVVEVDRGARRVTRVVSGSAVPLRRYREDRRLPPP